MTAFYNGFDSAVTGIFMAAVAAGCEDGVGQRYRGAEVPRDRGTAGQRLWLWRRDGTGVRSATAADMPGSDVTGMSGRRWFGRGRRGGGG